MVARTEARLSRKLYRYSFQIPVALDQVEDSLLLAVMAAEGVHGQSQVRMDGEFLLDESKRACVVDATTPVGETIARVFTTFLVREFGEDAFAVERVASEERIGRPEMPLHTRNGR